VFDASFRDATAQRSHERAAGMDYDPVTGAPVRRWIWERVSTPHALAAPPQSSELGDDLAALAAWGGRFVAATIRQAGMLLALVAGWELSRQAGTDGWPGMIAVIAITAAVQASTKGERT